MKETFHNYGSMIIAIIVSLGIFGYLFAGPIKNPRYGMSDEPQYVYGIMAYSQKATQQDKQKVEDYQDIKETDIHATHIKPELIYRERGKSTNGSNNTGIHIRSNVEVDLKDHVSFVSDEACGKKTLKFAVKKIYLEDQSTLADEKNMDFIDQPFAKYNRRADGDPYQTINGDDSKILIRTAGVYYAVLISDFDDYGIRTEELVAIHVDSAKTN